MRTNQSYAVSHNGKIQYYLNQGLAERMGVTDQELINLIDLHQHKLSLFDNMEVTKDTRELKQFAKQVEQIEFDLQKNWHFPQDSSFHEWYTVPQCTCPHMDNADMRGIDRRIISQSCPVHGQQTC